MRARVIPCLLLDGTTLLKTVKFGAPTYIGDPVNTVRIFNELEVDELCLLDVAATRERRPPNFDVLAEVASEAFMPLCYGGGVRDVETAGKLLRIGFEKVVLNSAAVERPRLVTEVAEAFGRQAVIVSIDARKKLLRGYEVVTASATRKTGLDPVEWAARAADLGAGELLITAVDREGTWSGYDTQLIAQVTRKVSVPVIANGGAGRVEHLAEAVFEGGAAAVALGSMVVFQGKDLGVLVNFPDRAELRRVLKDRAPF